MREPRRVFSKDHLLEIVWGHDFEGGPNIVETYISYLRAKIDRPGEPVRSFGRCEALGTGSHSKIWPREPKKPNAELTRIAFIRAVRDPARESPIVVVILASSIALVI